MISKSQFSNLKSVAKLATLLTVCCLLIAALACNNRQVDAALGDAAAGGKSVAAAAVAKYGADSPQAKKYQKWADSIVTLRADYAKATTPDEQVKLLPALNAITDFFETDVLPELKLDPIIAAGIDAGLRIAANHFVQSADAVPAAAKSTMAARRAGADAADTSVEKLRTFASKRLRCRDAVTGRFAKMEQCKTHPESTVVERVR